MRLSIDNATSSLGKSPFPGSLTVLLAGKEGGKERRETSETGQGSKERETRQQLGVFGLGSVRQRVAAPTKTGKDDERGSARRSQPR